MLFDSHTHIQFPEFDADRDAVVKRALEVGIWMVNVGTNVESSKKAVELAHQYPEGVYATVGIHPVRDEISNGASPHDVDADYDFAQIEELAHDPRVVGIGETGLDYFGIMKHETRNPRTERAEQSSYDGNMKHEAEIKEKQRALFIRHIELSQKVGKPLIIHCRDAHDDLFKILVSCFKFHVSSPRGVMHFFGGDDAWENLDEYLKMGFYISLAGVISFKNYKDAENIKRIPLDRILVETDAPYVAPEPHRGKRNEPLFIKHTAEKLAEIKGVSFEEIECQTTLNVKRLFQLF